METKKANILIVGIILLLGGFFGGIIIFFEISKIFGVVCFFGVTYLGAKIIDKI